MTLKAVLFDLDGVLLDTEGIYTDFWSSIDRRFPTGVDNFAAVIKGNTLTNILSTYFPDEDVKAQIRRLLVEQELNMPYRLFDGAIELVEGLKGMGISTAIVTSSTLAKMKNVLSSLPRLAQAIDTLVTDEDVTESKPHPQGYLMAAERLGAAEGEFIVVEDSMAGLEAGRRSGAFVTGIATTNPMQAVATACDLAVNAIADLTPLRLTEAFAEKQ
ncbi:MAG: HAD family phosphatase [Muribaculaceae bacterium]|nr:HAD family phosphatase [Muribaculaceae bacterium]